MLLLPLAFRAWDLGWKPSFRIAAIILTAIAIASAHAQQPPAPQPPQRPAKPLDPELKQLEGKFLALYLKGRAIEGDAYVRELFESAQRQDPPDRAAYATELMVLSLIAQHRLAEVAPLYEAMLQFLRHKLGQLHPDIPRLHRRLANFLASVGHYDQAEPHYRAATALLQQILGPRDPDHARVVLERAANLEILERYDEAEQLLRETTGVVESVFGTDSVLAGAMWERLAIFYDARGREEDGIRAWTKSKEILRLLTGGDFIVPNGRAPGMPSPSWSGSDRPVSGPSPQQRSGGGANTDRSLGSPFQPTR